MYHDMGLIACFWLPLWFGLPSFQLAASDWLLCPESLFEFLDRYRGTLCWLPNFAFSYLAQRRPAMLGPFSLHHVRAWINCSEPVRLRSTRAFVDAFAEWGVRPAQIQASYAMAETVFAVTQSPLAGNPLTVPRAQVFANHSASLAYNLLDDVFVSSGPPLPDTQLRIIRDGAVCPDFQAGEIQLRTPSLFSGYWGPEGFRTDCFTADQWYATGDYGFLDQGHLYVIGRIKDIIIVGGQNVFPEDVEALANTVPGVYPGRAVAFGLDDESLGTQSLALVAEMRGDYSSQSAESIEAAIRRVVLTSLGIAPRRVLVVPERWILKSTAGKISRRETRDRFLLEADSLSLAAEPR
jgi:acyl-CoA synthetase (AMP-forming)/AMP-acid ligase II